jgi:hypothetical protein
LPLILFVRSAVEIGAGPFALSTTSGHLYFF